MTKIPDKKKSDRILEEVKRRKEREKIIDVDEEKVKLLFFSLLGDFYAVNCVDAKEILTLGKITCVPGSPDFIIGILNVRGDIESVLDIHKFLGLSRMENSPQSRIIIMAKEGIRSGILVDSVEDVIDIPSSSIKPPVSTIDKSIKGFVIGEIIHNNKNVTLIEIGKIFKTITT